MYNSQDIADRIKSRAKERNINIGEMLSKCELGINTVSKIAKGTDILTKNFAKIADYLDCSIDYLLGRTDYPESHKLGKDSIVIHPAKEETISYKLAAYGGDFKAPKGKKPKLT